MSIKTGFGGITGAVVLWGLAAGVFAEAAPGHVAARDDRRAVFEAVELVRRAEDALVQWGDPYRCERFLREAQAILRDFPGDDGLRRAHRVLGEALTDLRSEWLDPGDRPRRIRAYADEAIRLIESSRSARGGERPPGPGGGPAAAMPLVGTYTKAGFEPTTFTVSIARETRDRGYSTIVVDVERTDRFTVIIASILVRVGGQWQRHAVAHRTQEGRNEYAAPVPQGATELRFSVDHGHGSKLTVYLR